MQRDQLTLIVTGCSSGIGEAFCKYAKNAFTELRTYKQLCIIGIDVNYGNALVDKFYQCDVSVKEDLPSFNLRDFNLLDFGDAVLINNAGIQEGSDESVIGTNLFGVMNCTEKYVFEDKLNVISVVNLASVSAHNGAEFPAYCASKGGVLSYTINTAKRMAPTGICNSLSFGGVDTLLNKPVMEDQTKWEQILNETPMRKWMTSEEAASWIWWVGVCNKSMTGQDIIIDNGEFFNHNFIW